MPDTPVTEVGHAVPSLPADATASAVAVYRQHEQAEDAVRRLERAGIPMHKISIIGRDFQLQESVQGYYRPSDAALEGAGFGAWVGGLFGMLMGFGWFLLPVAGPLVVLGPLAGLIAGAIGGAGIGALVHALVALGMSEEDALKLQARLQAGEFLVTVSGTREEAQRAREILRNTGEIEIKMHDIQQVT